MRGQYIIAIYIMVILFINSESHIPMSVSIRGNSVRVNREPVAAQETGIIGLNTLIDCWTSKAIRSASALIYIYP
jgi:hypothetical protein